MSDLLSFPDAVPHLFEERVSLRELTEDDIPAWFERATDAEAADLAGDPIPSSIEVGLQWLQGHRKRFREKTAIRWAIVPAGSGESVGTVGLILKANEARTAELAIVIARPFWGKGIGTLAASMVIGYAFAKLGLAEIQAIVLRRNFGSIRLLEKTGFLFLRVIPATAYEPDELVQYVLSRRSHSAA
jgi:[ribosomal protein S5]-alanine N-acetyltransferase